MKKIAVVPGSFDPITVGHLDIIERASQLFDKVEVVVMRNGNKGGGMFTLEERVALIKKSTKHLENVEVDYAVDNLLVEEARVRNAVVIIKGLRAVTDFDYELQMALANKVLAPEIETVFLPCKSEHMFVSSSLVRELATLGGDYRKFVPEEILDDIFYISKGIHKTITA